MLRTIRKIVRGSSIKLKQPSIFDSKRDIFYSISEARSNLEYIRQQKESDEGFYDTFRSYVDAFEHFGGSIGYDEGLIEELRNPADTNNPGNMSTGSTMTVTELTD